jgi:hypothetical protein
MDGARWTAMVHGQPQPDLYPYSYIPALYPVFAALCCWLRLAPVRAWSRFARKEKLSRRKNAHDTMTRDTHHCSGHLRESGVRGVLRAAHALLG